MCRVREKEDERRIKRRVEKEKKERGEEEQKTLRLAANYIPVCLTSIQYLSVQVVWTETNIYTKHCFCFIQLHSLASQHIATHPHIVYPGMTSQGPFLLHHMTVD